MTDTIAGTWEASVDLADAARAIGRAERFAWCEAELERYTYKPNFTLEMVRAPSDRWYDAYLCGSFRAPDSRHTPLDAPADWPTTKINFSTPVPSHIVSDRDSGMFADWLRGTLRGIEAHELDEWLRRDGVILHDPHAGKPTPTMAALEARDLIEDVTLP